MNRAASVMVLAATCFTAGCGGSSPGPRDAPLPPPPTTLGVEMREYRFDISGRRRISPGRVVFRVRNAGRVDHQLILVALPKSFVGSLSEQLQDSKRQGVLPAAILAGRRPNQTGSFAVDLPQGRYGMVCFLKTPDGRSHAVQGMNAELSVE